MSGQRVIVLKPDTPDCGVGCWASVCGQQEGGTVMGLLLKLDMMI